MSNCMENDHEYIPAPWNRCDALTQLFLAEQAMAIQNFRSTVLDSHSSYGTYLVQYPGYTIDVVTKEAGSGVDILDALKTVGLKARYVEPS